MIMSTVNDVPRTRRDINRKVMKMKGRKGKHWETHSGRSRTRNDKKKRPKPIHSKAMDMAKMRFDQVATRNRAKVLAEQEKIRAERAAAQGEIR